MKDDSNAGPNAKDGDLHREERQFERLPKGVRQELAFAPYKFGPMKMFADKVKAHGADYVVREIRTVSRQMVKSEAYRLYGEDHPQTWGY